VAEHAAAAAGGERDLGPEGPGERRGQPQRPRRLVGDGNINPDTAAQDRADAESLYRALETEVVPRFFGRDEAGLPRDWIATMKASIESVVSPFSAHRMVRDYVVGSYLPAADARKG
jgi:glucan phosphorylase